MKMGENFPNLYVILNQNCLKLHKLIENIEKLCKTRVKLAKSSKHRGKFLKILKIMQIW